MLLLLLKLSGVRSGASDKSSIDLCWIDRSYMINPKHNVGLSNSANAASELA